MFKEHQGDHVAQVETGRRRWREMRRGHICRGEGGLTFQTHRSHLASSSSNRISSRLSKREMCAKRYERGDRREYITGQINIVWVIKMFVSTEPLLQRR